MAADAQTVGNLVSEVAQIRQRLDAGLGRVAGVESLSGQTRDRVDVAEKEFTALNARMHVLELLAASWGHGTSKATQRRITESGAYKAFPAFSGKAEEWNDWLWKLNNLLTGYSLNLDELLTLIKKADQVSETDLCGYQNQKGITSEELQLICETIWDVLSSKTQGTQLKLVKAVCHEGWTRGPRALRKLLDYQFGRNQEYLQDLAKAVMHPTRVASMDKALEGLETWELQVREYTEATGTRRPEPELITAVRNLVPQALEQKINDLAGELDYDDVMCYVRKQLRIHREARGMAKPRLVQTSGPDKMDVDAVWAAAVDATTARCVGAEGAHEGPPQEHGAAEEGCWHTSVAEPLNAMQSGKGKGKSRGCWTCGDLGHHRASCPYLWKGAAMATPKGKGATKGSSASTEKGFKGKGAPKGLGKGPEKGKGKGYNHYSQTYPAYQPYSPYPVYPAYSAEVDHWTHDLDWHKAETMEPMMMHLGFTKPIETRNQFEALQDMDGFEELEEITQELEEITQELHELYQEKEHMDQENEGGGPKRRPDLVKRKQQSMANSQGGEVMLTDAEMVVCPCSAACAEDDASTSWTCVDRRRRHQPSRKVLGRWRNWSARQSLTGHHDSAIQQLESVSPVDASGLHSLKNNGYTCVESLMDTGAVMHVMPKAVASHVPIRESSGSKAGQQFSTASGEQLPNLGERKIRGLTEDCESVELMYQVADITKQLNSVGKICDTDKMVTFTKLGGYIQDVNTGRRVNFKREDGLYVLKMWVKADEDF